MFDSAIQCKAEQDEQTMCNLTMRRVRATIVVLEKH